MNMIIFYVMHTHMLKKKKHRSVKITKLRDKQWVLVSTFLDRVNWN